MLTARKEFWFDRPVENTCLGSGSSIFIVAMFQKPDTDVMIIRCTSRPHSALNFSPTFGSFSFKYEQTAKNHQIYEENLQREAETIKTH